MKQLAWKTLALMALTFSLASCDNDDDDNNNQAQARVMVVHASPNAPNVDVRVNNTVALTNVAYPSNSMYTAVNSGSTNIKVSPTGTTNYVIDANVNLDANRNYSVFAIDSVSKIKAAVIGDDLTTPASGKAHIRFLHFSPNAPAVNIVTSTGTTLFSNRTFNDQATNANVTAFTPVDAGNVTVEVKLASNNATVVSAPLTLTAGKIYTIFAKGFVGGTGAQALGAQVIMNN